MSTAIAKQQTTTLATAQAPTFTPEQERMIRDSFLSGAGNEEAGMLMEIARIRRLNPLLRQIHFVKRWDSQKRAEVWSYQVSIDGLRAIAERTGNYDGQSDPEWDYGKDGLPTKCVIRVYRKDWSAGHHAAGVAFYEEYVQKKRDGGITQFWATKPRLMLAKCAEALALRKAFPEDMGGLYTAEEMGQDDDVPTAPAKPAPVAAAPKPEPVVERDPVEQHPDQTRRAAHALVEAAAATLGATVEPGKPAGTTKQRALMVWKRATDSKTHNMTRAMFEKWVRITLGFAADAPMPTSYTPEQLDTLEHALDAESTVP